MIAERSEKKRLIATGRKVDGVWQVKTFLRTALTTKTRETLWQARTRRPSK
jgi:hypothetical protein